jgi:hypothetical protein
MAQSKQQRSKDDVMGIASIGAGNRMGCMHWGFAWLCGVGCQNVSRCRPALWRVTANSSMFIHGAKMCVRVCVFMVWNHSGFVLRLSLEDRITAVCRFLLMPRFAERKGPKRGRLLTWLHPKISMNHVLAIARVQPCKQLTNTFLYLSLEDFTVAWGIL